MRRNNRKDVEVFALCKNLRQEYYINRPENFQPACGLVTYFLDYEWSPFFLNDSIASETRARVKITPHEKSETRRGERKKWGLLVVYLFPLLREG